MSDEFLVEHRGPVALLTLNRPPLNLMTYDVLVELSDTLDALTDRDETRVIVLRGAGPRAFCAGADIKRMGKESSVDPATMRQLGAGIVNKLERHKKVTVSAVQGWCIGGGTALAWPCDIRIASASAKYRAADAYLGMTPGWGFSLVRMTHYIGRNHCMDILITGDDITAQRAYQMGLVTYVFPDESFEADVMRVAEKLATAAPLAVQSVKEGLRAQFEAMLPNALEVENKWVERVRGSADMKEGIRAAQEKRPPVYRGA